MKKAEWSLPFLKDSCREMKGDTQMDDNARQDSLSATWREEGKKERQICKLKCPETKQQ